LSTASRVFADPLQVYTRQKGIDAKSILLMFDGGRLDSEQTLAEQGVEDQDSIEVMVKQSGGGRWSPGFASSVPTA
jgi:hypothetical protein